MNILIAVPHYFAPEVGGFCGALRPDNGYCAKGLAALILSLHENFGRTQMFINQAARQFQLWTNHLAPTDLMCQVLRLHLG